MTNLIFDNNDANTDAEVNHHQQQQNGESGGKDGDDDDNNNNDDMYLYVVQVSINLVLSLAVERIIIIES